MKNKKKIKRIKLDITAKHIVTIIFAIYLLSKLYITVEQSTDEDKTVDIIANTLLRVVMIEPSKQYI
jgi:hypothetical protein